MGRKKRRRRGKDKEYIEKGARGSIYKCLTRMDVDISNIGSKKIDFLKDQSRGTFGQVSAL